MTHTIKTRAFPRVKSFEEYANFSAEEIRPYCKKLKAWAVEPGSINFVQFCAQTGLTQTILEMFCEKSEEFKAIYYVALPVLAENAKALFEKNATEPKLAAFYEQEYRQKNPECKAAQQSATEGARAGRGRHYVEFGGAFDTSFKHPKLNESYEKVLNEQLDKRRNTEKVKHIQA